MSKGWRMLTCFVVVPLAAPAILFLPRSVDTSGLSGSAVLIAAVAGSLSWLAAYWPKRNGGEALVYAVVSAALSVPALLGWIFVWLITCDCLD